MPRSRHSSKHGSRHRGRDRERDRGHHRTTSRKTKSIGHYLLGKTLGEGTQSKPVALPNAAAAATTTKAKTAAYMHCPR